MGAVDDGLHRAKVVAHSPNESGEWHRLTDHLEGTGRLATEFAEPFGASSLAGWLGRSHDLGKACTAWQEALRAVAGTNRTTGVPHKAHAAFVARSLSSQAASLVAASALLGHHSGMPDRASRDAGRAGVIQILKDTALAAPVDEALATLAAAGFPDLRREAAQVRLPGWLPLTVGDMDAARRVEMFTRMTFSALVDADFLDTEAHFRELPGPRVASAADFGQILTEFSAARGDLFAGSSGSPVAAVRERVYRSCVDSAELPPGLFRLPAPTGAGKTLAVAGFATRHAALHGLRRVVFAMPFTSITTQNAEVYRQVFDTPEQARVLEHHSAVLDGQLGSSPWRKLAAQNWDAPIVVTTTVQLFESLMTNRPSKARRLHRLSRSVIVLDEVQALPLHLIPVLLDLLKAMIQDYGATVVLCTATQPEFWALPVWEQLPAASLLPDETQVRSDLRRVTYQWRTDPPATWSQVAGWIAAERSALVIVNTTRDAQDLHREVVAFAEPGTEVLHLSTRMCADHRREVLRRARALLTNGDSVLVVSTQVVEAGVDLDFPVVFRALAPAESIAQAGGRANREGRLADGGRVVIFNPAEGGSPQGSYRTATSSTRALFADRHLDPDDPEALASYYRDLFGKLLPAGHSSASDQIQSLRETLSFASAAEAFKMIDDGGVPVIVEWQDDAGRARGLVDRLLRGEQLEPRDWRFLQGRSASLPKTTAAGAVRGGLAISVRGGLDDGGQGPALLFWATKYDPCRGVDPQAITEAKEVIW